MITPITLQPSRLPLSLSRSPRRIFPTQSASQNYLSENQISIQSPTLSRIKIEKNTSIPGMKMVQSQMEQCLQQNSANDYNKIPELDPTPLHNTGSSINQIIPYGQNSNLILPYQEQSLQQSQTRVQRSNYELSLPRAQVDDLIDQFDWDKYGVNPYIPCVIQPTEYENQQKQVQYMPSNQYLALPDDQIKVSSPLDSSYPKQELQQSMEQPITHQYTFSQPHLMTAQEQTIKIQETVQTSAWDSGRYLQNIMESQRPSINNSGIVAVNFSHQSDYYCPVKENINNSQIYIYEQENFSPDGQYNNPDQSYKQDYLPTPSQTQSIDLDKEQEIHHQYPNKTLIEQQNNQMPAYIPSQKQSIDINKEQEIHNSYQQFLPSSLNPIEYQDNQMSQKQQSKPLSQQNSVRQHPIRFDRNQNINACNIF